jgi:hypothetical protein
MRATQRMPIVCWARTENGAPERISERMDESNTKVIYRLLGWDTTGIVSPERINGGLQKKTFSPERIPRESMRETQWLSIVCWARTENVSLERIPERINEINTKVVYCLLGKNRKRFLR